MAEIIDIRSLTSTARIICFKVSKDDYRTIQLISRRAMTLLDAPGSRIAPDRDSVQTDIEMDLIATHVNGCPLDLEKFLTACDPDFLHDLSGIRMHLNRITEVLDSTFEPKCSRRI